MNFVTLLGYSPVWCIMVQQSRVGWLESSRPLQGYPAHKKPTLPWSHHRALGIGLL